MNILFTRHGKTEWNNKGIIMGRRNEPLNSEGLGQAENTRDILMEKDIDLIICSPLIRARQTAEIIKGTRDIPIIFDEKIIERDYGEFEGKTRSDFNFTDFWDYYKNEQYKDAESIQTFFNRIYRFLDDITQKYESENILLVAHAGVSILVRCYFNDRIPLGSLANLALKNCQIASYQAEQKEDERLH